MEEYLKEYIEHFKFKSLDTPMFKKHFNRYFKKKGKWKQISEVKWGDWLHSTGMPLKIPK
jgi:nucleoside-specific outer membrane channel protein Tsx